MSNKRIKKKKEKKTREINTEKMRRYKSDVARANREVQEAEIIEIMGEPIQEGLNNYFLMIKYKLKGVIKEMKMPFVSWFEVDNFLKNNGVGSKFEILMDFKVTYE